MLPHTRTLVFPIAVFLLLLALAMPAGAYTVATYGTSAGFDPALHTDSVVVVRSVPGAAGSDLDAAIDDFTPADVIVLGGDDSFSSATAAKIDAAVATGKILVVTYPCNRLFDASLPADNGGSAPAGSYLDVASPASAVSQEIFKNLPAQYTLQGTAPDKEQAVARGGATVLLTDDAGLPVLLYRAYGRGAVIEWATAPVPSYLTAAQADTIIDRTITRLLPAPATTTTAVTTTVATTAATTPGSSQTAVATPSITTATAGTGTGTDTGDIDVYSSPTGASILIDGIYRGVTPASLTGIAPGSHIVRLTRSGYYDYEGTIYIVAGQTSHAFGTLPPLGLATASATAIPIEIVVTAAPAATTASGGILSNSSVIVALIGVITAMIAAGATMFTHLFKKKE
jgi:hypothetical protein